MNPISLVHLHNLLLTSPRSHRSATGPRSKTQPTTTRHTQRKHTRHDCWHLKPVRPISETGQTASVELTLTLVGETGQTQNPPETQNTSRAFPPLNKRTHSTTETPLLKNPSWQPTGLNRSHRFGNPVRPGQSGRTHPAGKTQNSKRSMSQFVPRIKVRLWG
jgi:hypothetical protein